MVERLKATKVHNEVLLTTMTPVKTWVETFYGFSVYAGWEARGDCNITMNTHVNVNVLFPMVPSTGVR